jgi:heme/copper-type cytochrome/quinol oxidase subunit 1
MQMKLTPPTKLAFWISVVLVALGLIGTFVTLPFVSGLAFWFVFVGYVVLLLGLLVKGF